MDMDSYIDEFRRVLHNVHRSTFRNLKPLLDEANLTFPQLLIMELIEANGLKMKEIAETMNVSLPAITGFVDKLSNLDYVQRLDDPSDRRVNIIVLTTNGKSTLDSIQKARAKRMSLVFDNFSDDELKEYLKLMHKLERTILNQ